MNKSGIYPAGHRVLVLPEKALETKNGLIEIPDHVQERHGLAQTAGRVIAIGQTAWKADWAGGDAWAKPGDRIMFAKYGGLPVKGVDGEQYRLINDEDLIAVIDEELDVDTEERK